MDLMKTPAERAREKTLLNDPLALVLNPSLVECKQCHKKIKLSSKSAFDTFHWRNHRARCLRTIKKKKTKGILPPLTRRPIPTPLKAATTPRPPHPEPRKSKTPPLIDISDSEEERRSEQSPEAQSPPSTLPWSPFAIQTPPDIRHSDAFLDDYILRSHPECFQRATPLSDHWQSWSWSQLKEPHFPPSAYNQDDDLEYDEDDDHISHYSSLTSQDERAQEAAHALSMLSRSRPR
ncbi:hypothetical protein GALMADRAFT_135815 [Galerina marginata CBS 339.88]|uniref:Uncharacterized protein n=1 Tax=Galerina marginata (strain CBS 339.88) TaxID=685588 RepID=A0A067TBU2_GALM3|nr:hypothetical protein GALMADRAFT_135815 [Galerina marginata CBS 339.88]